MFMGDARIGGDWRDEGMNGMYRFMNRVWNISESIIEKGIKKTADENILKSAHKAIKRVGDDLERLKFNTAISQLMILLNAFQEQERIDRSSTSGGGRAIEKADFEKFLILLAPFAPHITEELWHELGNKESVHDQKWPTYDPKRVQEEVIRLVLQVNGKVRDVVEAPADIAQKEAEQLALGNTQIQKWLAGNKPKKVIFVPGKLVNVVV